MKRPHSGFARSFFSFLMIVTLAFPVHTISAFAEESAADSARTKIKHTQLKYVVPGKRIVIEAALTDPDGISLARCYFKSPEEANFVFVPMTVSGKSYRAILPAMVKEAASLEYVLLSVNGKKQIFRTQPFSAPVDAQKKTPKWQQVGDAKPLKVGVEQDKAPEKVAGFSDSIEYDVVESAARFGLVGGVVGGVAVVTSGAAAGGAASVGVSGAAAGGTASAGAAGGAASAGASGAAAGGAAATGTGLSTTSLVAIAAGVAVVGGITAVAAGGGGGGGGGGIIIPQTITYKANGTVSTSGNALADVTLNLSGGGQSATATTDPSGNFSFAVPNGSYTIVPAKTGYTFSPSSMSVSINDGNVGALNFTASGSGSITVSW